MTVNHPSPADDSAGRLANLYAPVGLVIVRDGVPQIELFDDATLVVFRYYYEQRALLAAQQIGGRMYVDEFGDTQPLTRNTGNKQWLEALQPAIHDTLGSGVLVYPAIQFPPRDEDDNGNYDDD